jgi:hypothetical protein
MEDEIRYLIAKYGYAELFTGIEQMMRKEYEFLNSHFKGGAQVLVAQPPVQPVLAAPVKEKKERKQRAKKVVAPKPAFEKIEPAIIDDESILATNEIKEVVVTDVQGFRDPKEVKEFQKSAEEKKRKENEAAGIQLNTILTKDNLKQWVEVEGKTYSWVAREKAGCPDTQVAATAQMMGIRSKISKRRGIMMGGH